MAAREVFIQALPGRYWPRLSLNISGFKLYTPVGSLVVYWRRPRNVTTRCGTEYISEETLEALRQ